MSARMQIIAMTKAARAATVGSTPARCAPSLSMNMPESQPPTAIPRIIAVTTMFIPSFNSLVGSIRSVRTWPAIEVGEIKSPATNNASAIAVKFRREREGHERQNQ